MYFLFIYIAKSFCTISDDGLFRAKWSEEIHQEWILSLHRNKSDLSQEKIKKVKDLINMSVLDGLVSDYEPLIEKLDLPDAGDRHVLAVAIKCGAQSIITNNLKDFPKSSLKQFNIEAITADQFLSDLWDLSPQIVLLSLKKCRERLVNPSFSGEEYLHSLTKQGFIKSVPRFRSYQSLI